MAYAMDNRGGGQALPPYLQGRSASPQGPYQTKPMITPKSTVRPGEAGRPGGPGGPFQQVFGQKPGMGAARPKPAGKPGMTPAMQPPMNPQGAMQPSSPFKSMFDYGKSQLEEERKSALAGAQSDAASRGVFYGTPLTTSQGDIQTEYLKGLGKLTADISGLEMDDKFRRQDLAARMLAPHQQSDRGGIDPDIFQMLGSLFQGGPDMRDPERGKWKPPVQQLPANTPGVPDPNKIKLRGVTPQPVK